VVTAVDLLSGPREQTWGIGWEQDKNYEDGNDTGINVRKHGQNDSGAPW